MIVRMMCLFAVAMCILPCGRAESFVEDSFDDFADGVLDASGQNLYVAHDGSVRSIHRFDMNHDGHIDLLLNCTHDLIGILPSTAGWVTSDRNVEHAALAVEGASAVAVADLNRDGHTDLVFCPNNHGIQTSRRFVTTIYGGDDGWPPARSNGVLPVSGATAVAVCDLNADDWPDIAVLNGLAWMPRQDDGRIVRVYWGSEHGFALGRFQDFGVPNILTIESADFDEDGASDLAALESDNSIEFVWAVKSDAPVALNRTSVSLRGEGAQCMTAADFNGDEIIDVVVSTSSGNVVLLAGKSGREWHDPRILPAFSASHIAAGDLDNDGHLDLALTQVAIARASGGEATGADKDRAGYVKVLWGDSGAFDATRSTELVVPFATASAIGDLDGDSHNDLSVSVYQDEATFSTDGVIFFGNGTRSPVRGKSPLPISGSTDVAFVPGDNGNAARVVFANSAGGTVNERVPTYLYYGGPDGFDPNRKLLIPFVSGYEASAADLNLDGWTDIIAMCSGHLGPGAQSLVELGANIFWGTQNGVDIAARPTVLRESNLFSSNVADLNKDGYLDLVLGAFDPPKPGEKDVLAIYYGGKNGYSVENRKALDSEGRSAMCVIADFDKDTWLDIGVTSFNRDLVRLFWGGKEGFSDQRQTQLSAPQPIDMETADLNADGFLDLIVGSYYDNLTQHFDTGSLIFWGSREGFREWNAQWLPGSAPVGITVADFDGDGHLDLFCPHYHGNLTRENLPSYLYWGSESGFDTRRRTTFICDSPSDGLAADFNGDGKLDLAVSCHTRDGNHAADSKVYYNDGNRFENPKVTLLPAVGPHWIWTEDMGHIYNRTWQQTYESSVFAWTDERASASIRAEADTSAGATLDLEMRSASDASALGDTSWRAASGKPVVLDATHRCLQYRAIFKSSNGDRYPVLHRVSIEIAR